MGLVTRLGGLGGQLASSELSAGEQQLLCLARAVLSPAKLVLIDEATANVDQETDRVYWADSKLDVIETVKIDGSDRRAILTTRTIHPFSLAVFEDTLYWSDWETREVVSCNKYTGKDYRVLIKEAGIRPMGIAVAHPVSMEAGLEAPCSAADCSHVCLPRAPPSKGFTCACPSHQVSKLS